MNHSEEWELHTKYERVDISLASVAKNWGIDLVIFAEYGKMTRSIPQFIFPYSEHFCTLENTFHMDHQLSSVLNTFNYKVHGSPCYYLMCGHMHTKLQIWTKNEYIASVTSTNLHVRHIPAGWHGGKCLPNKKSCMVLPPNRIGSMEIYIIK